MFRLLLISHLITSALSFSITKHTPADVSYLGVQSLCSRRGPQSALGLYGKNFKKYFNSEFKMIFI